MIYVGIYARLSVEHDKEKDNSIDNQILLARRWIEERKRAGEKLCEYRCYADIGVSGMTFHRPEFEKMMAEAGEGRIQCIVCKDSSRLGRDYLKTGEYMEKILPSMNIRLVLISDRYDSGEGLPGSLEGSMRNLMNEWYARDIGNKVAQVKRYQREQGNYLGSRAPYGKRIQIREGRRTLVQDEQVQAVIEYIRKLSEQGSSITQIREKLFERGIHPPAVYRETGETAGEKFLVKKWDRGTIRNCLRRYSD